MTMTAWQLRLALRAVGVAEGLPALVPASAGTANPIAPTTAGMASRDSAPRCMFMASPRSWCKADGGQADSPALPPYWPEHAIPRRGAVVGEAFVMVDRPGVGQNMTISWAIDEPGWTDVAFALVTAL